MLGIQGVLNLLSTETGRPYETWDEIAAYNSAALVNGPAADRLYRYGSFDTFLQRLAIKYYETLDPVGRTHRFGSYLNNVDASLNNSRVWPGEKTWDWTHIDSNFFRGVPDHEAIFISRKLHLGFIYCVALIAGCLVIYLYDIRALALIVPLLAFLSGPVFAFEATQSLPTAGAAILGFTCALFAMIYVDRQQARYLLVSVVVLAVAVNFKVDAVLMGAAPALALVLECWRRGFRAALSDATAAAAAGACAAVLTRPSLLPNPLADIRSYVYTLNKGFDELGFPANPGRYSWPDIDSRVRILARFLGANVFANGIGAPLALLVVCIIFLGFGVFVLASRDRQRLTAGVGACAGAMIWAYIILRYPALIWDRYFLSGLGACYAALGMFALYYHADKRKALRYIGLALLAGISLQYVVNALHNAKTGLATVAEYRGSMGLDPANTRNVASLAVLDLVKDYGPGTVVLVDQHGYFDLRLFWQHQIEPRYINMYNADAVLGAVDPSKTYVILFSRGTTNLHVAHPAYVGTWAPEKIALYAKYQSLLTRLPIRMSFGDHSQEILDAAPLNPSDEISIAVLGSDVK